MGNFFKQIIASFIGTVIGMVVGLGLFFGAGALGLALLFMAAASPGEPESRDKSILKIDLSLAITDGNRRIGLEESFLGTERQMISLRAVVDAINSAAKDEKIVAIYLDGSGSGGSSGLATLREIRTALEKFRAAGKKIIAYDIDWTKRDYYLGSVADQVVVDPMGYVEIAGLSYEEMFVSGALSKYGIGVQVIRAGKYKAAVEPFVAQQMSLENRQQTQLWLNQVWSEFTNTVGKSRNLSPSHLQTWANMIGSISPESAQQFRLVDRIAHADQVEEELRKLTGQTDRPANQISLRRYAKTKATEVVNKPQKIALVYAQGEITSESSNSGQVSSKKLAAQLESLRQNKDVKAIVLRVNSPGGGATASEQILRQVQLTNQKKPVVISMGDYAASGGYWISAYGRRIFAEPNTITGSIGVFGLLFNVGELARQNGITWDTVKTGGFADAQTISRPKTPQELAVYQREVDRIYAKFVAKVAEARKLSPAKVDEVAQGRVWSGQQAKEIGLVDEIGGLEEAIAYAAKAANLGQDWQLIEPDEDLPWPDQLVDILQIKYRQVNADPITKEIQNLHRQIQILKNLNDPQNIYARLPFNLHIK